MRARLHNKAEELKVAEIGAVSGHIRASDFSSQLLEKDEIIKSLQTEVQDLKQQVSEVQGKKFVNPLAQRKSEGTALLEIEHIKADNDRLVKLLHKTKEYKNFGKYADNTTGSVRYLPPTDKKKYPSKDITENVDPNLEEKFWVPREAFEIAYRIRDNNDGKLDDLMINELLKSLNVVWRERERKNIARGKCLNSNV